MAYQYPNLWQGCVGAWCPSVDRSRSTLLTDFSGRGNNGLLTGMDPGTDWVASNDKIALDFNMAETNRVVTTFNSTKLYDLSRVTISVWFRARSSGEALAGRLLDCKEATGFSISNKKSSKMGKTVLALITPLICCNCLSKYEDDTINFINLF